MSYFPNGAYMRATLWVLIIIVVVAVPIAAVGAANSGEGAVNRQLLRTQAQDVTTSSKLWRDLLRVQVACPAAPDTATTVSVSLKGGSAPVRVRVQERPWVAGSNEQPTISQPRAVPFAVGQTTDSRAFTFLSNVQDQTNTGRNLVAQWRSPSGREATITSASIHAVFAQSTEHCL